MAKVKLTAPWDEYYEELNAFFKEDPGVTILYDEDSKDIKVLVNDAIKAEALTKLLNSEKEFGGVKLTITVIPANEVTKQIRDIVNNLNSQERYADEYNHALDSNDVFSYTKRVEGMFGFDATFVVFKKKVIQYYNDNLGDLNGMKSTLAEYIARDIFVPHNGVFFNTDTYDVNLNCRPVRRNNYNNYYTATCADE